MFALFFVLVFGSVLFSIMITLLRKEKAGLYSASREFVCLSLSFFFSSNSLGVMG